MGSTYRGRAVRVSERNYNLIREIKKGKGYKKFDSVITNALRKSGLTEKKKKKKRGKKRSVFSSKLQEDLGL